MTYGVCAICGKEIEGHTRKRVLRLCPECKAEREKARKRGDKVEPLPKMYVCRECKDAYPAICFVKRDTPKGRYTRDQYSDRCKKCIAESEEAKKRIAAHKAQEREEEHQRALLKAAIKRKLKADKKALEAELGRELSDERYRVIKAERAWERISTKAASAKEAGMSYGKWVAMQRQKGACV